MRGRRAPVAAPHLERAGPRTPAGSFVVLDGEEHYRIAGADRLDPFLVSLPSDTDLWMYVTSTGGLTAGRVDAEGSLFPYVTVDKLHQAHHHTGPVTLVRVTRPGGGDVLWEPLRGGDEPGAAVERNLYKNVTGNRLVFEEVDHELQLAFRYAWAACDEYGWVRTATLENLGAEPVTAVVLDGLRNVLPWGAPLALYQTASNLVDAYRTSEADPETGLGIFSLTAGITDRAEALEVLRANTVWCAGLEGHRVHLSDAAAAAFRRGQVLAEDRVVDGVPGCYLVSAALALAPDAYARWHLAADVGRDHVQVAALRRLLRGDDDLDGRVDEALRRAGGNLRRLVAGADGLQAGGRPEATAHHFANVLFNAMRGGVFVRNHDVPAADFADYLRVRNASAGARAAGRLADLPPTVACSELQERLRATGDADLMRLGLEYLPLHFGRRHGDPSRPWNRFSIRARNGDGSRRLHYEGNWRDIFQNWEALCRSFPGFLPGVVARFVNASTVDGFNPYRITREGVDWEVPAPDDPWSNIGYWGDHQIVYLLRLLEMLRRHDPGALDRMLAREVFSYADVPYRLKPYAEILADPRATIVYDEEHAARVAERVAARGSDGRLVHGADGTVRHANLLEKLLVPALAKLSNLVPDAGIWMNTQRPEWNDANNALAGGGVSVVTLCHLRRYLAFLADLLDGAAGRGDRLPVAAEVAAWFEDVAGVFAAEPSPPAGGGLPARDRKRLMDSLGEAFGAYRRRVYAHGLAGRRDLAVADVVALCRTALVFVDSGIAANRRADGLYHTYNLLEFAPDGTAVEVVRLQEMLEGQVAALSAGLLAPAEALVLLERLFASDLYRPSERSFMLYPERRLPGFLARNAVPADRADSVPLLRDMLAAGDGALVARDADGGVRFHGSFAGVRDVTAVLARLADDPVWTEAAERDGPAVLALFEEVFRHRAYLGRSAVMHGYEGLGCIYWHMVAKLLVAVQENVRAAEAADVPPEVREGLAAMYLRVRAGIGYEKPVTEYGAFPTDPYSHTPPRGGAKQPGMTGQVKEEILTRWGELGVAVGGGGLRFVPTLLEPRELLDAPAEFRYWDVEGAERRLALEAGSLAFTVCQVPVVYERAPDGAGGVSIVLADGTVTAGPGDRIAPGLASEIFARSGRVREVRVRVPAGTLGRLLGRTERPA